MRTRAWLACGLAAGGCSLAVANSQPTGYQPIFSPGVSSVPPDTGSIQGPSQQLGLPDSSMPKLLSQTQSVVHPLSVQRTSQIASLGSPAGLSGFAACWWNYYHSKRTKPC